MKKAKPKLGQHLLTDPVLLEHLVDLCHIKPEHTVIEIGPGKGALTQFLVSKSQSIHLIELDNAFFNKLKKNYTAEHIQLHHQDILQFNWENIQGKHLHIVGNLPYYLSSPLLIQMTQLTHRIHQLNFMLQLEVGQRLAAEPGSKAYGRLSILMQTFFDIELLMELPKELFTPPPKVCSIFIRMTPIKCPLSTTEIRILEKVTQQGFSQRRKKIKNSLCSLLSDQDWQILSIDSQLRAEALSRQDYYHICRYLSKKQMPAK